MLFAFLWRIYILVLKKKNQKLNKVQEGTMEIREENTVMGIEHLKAWEVVWCQYELGHKGIVTVKD